MDLVMELEQYVKITLNVLIFVRTKFRDFFFEKLNYVDIEKSRN